MAVEVVITRKDKAARVGKSQRCDAGIQGGVRVVKHLLVSAQVVHLAGTVVGACDDSISTGEELKQEKNNCLSLNVRRHRVPFT